MSQTPQDCPSLGSILITSLLILYLFICLFVWSRSKIVCKLNLQPIVNLALLRIVSSFMFHQLLRSCVWSDLSQYSGHWTMFAFNHRSQYFTLHCLAWFLILDDIFCSFLMKCIRSETSKLDQATCAYASLLSCLPLALKNKYFFRIFFKN